VATVHAFLKVSDYSKYQTKVPISGQPPNTGELLKLQPLDLQCREPHPSSIWFYVYSCHIVVLQAWI